MAARILQKPQKEEDTTLVAKPEMAPDIQPDSLMQYLAFVSNVHRAIDKLEYSFFI